MKTNRAFRAICLTTCLCFFVACYNEPNFQPEELTAESNETQQSPYHITLSTALDNMLNTMEVLSPSTRANEKTIRNIQTVTSADILQQTRSTNGEEPTDAYYIVNFENDEGFAILAADARFGCDVIALAERGNLFRTNCIESRITIGQNDTMEYRDAGETLTIEDLYRPEFDEYLLGGGEPGNNIIIPSIDSLYTDKSKYDWPEWPNDPDEQDDEITSETEYVTHELIEPLLSTQWHQHSPFNDLTPRRYYYRILGIGNSCVKEYGYDTSKILGYYNQRPTYAGCVAIAVAQILAYHEYPSTQTILNASAEENITSWATLKDVIGSDSISEDQKQHIARISRAIGNGCDMWYGFWDLSSFALPIYAKNYMASLGYQNTDRVIGYSLETVKEMLRNDCPVFMGGISGTVDGHAWVIDGYKHIKSTTEWYRNGEYTHMTTGNYMYTHCNWGWSGNCDGWFFTDIFDTTEGDYDDTINHNNNRVYHFDHWMRMVTYDKPNQ